MSKRSTSASFATINHKIKLIMPAKHLTNPKTYLQVFMSFFNSLPIIFFLPVMTIFTKVSEHFTVKEHNSTT